MRLITHSALYLPAIRCSDAQTFRPLLRHEGEAENMMNALLAASRERVIACVMPVHGLRQLDRACRIPGHETQGFQTQRCFVQLETFGDWSVGPFTM